MRRTLKIITWTIAIPLLLVLLLALALQFSYVQNFLTQKITQSLSQKLQTEVSIEEVNFKFFKSIDIKGIYAADSRHDTLLAVDQLSATIGLFSLLNKSIQLDRIQLDGLTVNLYNTPTDSTYNFQFIIDAFASDSTANTEVPSDTTSSGSAWDIGLGNLQLSNIRFTYRDSVGQMYLTTQLPDLQLAVKTFDLPSQTIVLDQLQLTAPVLDVATHLIPDTTSSGPLVFPYTGWNISLDQAQITQGNIRYWVDNEAVQAGHFDPQHLHFQSLDLDLQNMVWDSSRLEVQLNQLAFAEQSGWVVTATEAVAQLSPEKIVLQNFSLSTATSKIKNNTQLTFSDWNALSDFLHAVDYKSDFENCQISLEDIAYFLPFLPEDYRIEQPIFITGFLEGANAGVSLENIQLKIGDFFDFQSNGQLAHFDDPEQMQVDLDLQKLSVDYRQLRRTLPVLNLPTMPDSLGRISLSGKMKGSLDKINLRRLVLQTSTKTSLLADGEVRNLNKPKALSFSLTIDRFQTKAQDLAYFSSSPLPQGLYELENINYQGLLSGDLLDFSTKGQLTTAIGQLTTDLHLAFNPAYSNAAYDGKVQLQDFDLGLFLGDTATFGKASLDAAIEGQGLSLDSLNTRLETTVQAFVFKGYNYQQISINGAIDQLKFVGAASMEDPNLTFDFNGLVDLNEKDPVFKFDAAIDTIDFSALGLMPQVLRTSAIISSNFSGATIDDFFGDARINDWYLSNDTLDFHSDSLSLSVKRNAEKEKELQLRSDWLLADVTGDFNLTNLAPLLQNFFNDFFPIDQFISPVDTPDSLAIEPREPTQFPDQNIQFSLQLIHPEQLSLLFTPLLERLDSASLTGSFDSESKSIDFSVYAPTVMAAGWAVDSLSWSLKGDAQKMDSRLLLPMVTNGAMEFRQNLMTASISDKRLQTDFLVNNRQGNSVFDWGLQLSPQDNNYQLEFRDSLLVDRELWKLPEKANIVFGPGYLHIDQLTLQKKEQSLSIKSYDKPKDEDYTPVEMEFNNFRLGEFSALTDLEDFDYDGLINGKIRVNDFTGNLHYLADVTIDEVTVNDTLIGKITITAEQKTQAPVVNLTVALSGNENEMLAKGTYNLDNNEFDVKADIQKIPLILVDPFTLGAIQKSQGYISGNFVVKGTPDEPLLRGDLTFSEASTLINYLKTRYTIPQHTISIDEKKITIGQLQMLDSQKHSATLSGNIRHEYFQEYWFDLDFATDNFQFLNTFAQDNDLFYGTLNLSAKVHIGGTLDLPDLRINARTQKESQLFVQAFTDEQLTQQADYLIFGKPDELPLDSVLRIRSAGTYQSLAINMLLNLELNPDAELIVIVDPATGDELRCRGNADITVQMSPSGNIDVNGVYTVVSGSYQFNYQGLVKRSFELEAGSHLYFVGDPLNTRFDITAKYNTRASLYSLVANESSLSTAASQDAKLRTDVAAVMRISGNLEQPLLNFDLQIPEINNTELRNLSSQKIAQLREDESELNKQVFGLLLLNSFVADQKASAGLSAAGENIALSSVSNLISNQLNRLSDQYAKGLGLTFDLESNRDQFDNSNTTRTNLNVGLTQSLFNDRLTLKVGGVARVESGAESGTASSLSNIAGDFVLEYQLTKSGNYLLRVFQRSDLDAVNGENVNKTGVGVSFKKSFGK